jgi:hypothetical protein
MIGTFPPPGESAKQGDLCIWRDAMIKSMGQLVSLGIQLRKRSQPHLVEQAKGHGQLDFVGERHPVEIEMNGVSHCG